MKGPKAVTRSVERQPVTIFCRPRDFFEDFTLPKLIRNYWGFVPVTTDFRELFDPTDRWE